MNFLEAIVLGAVQGLTEFLPISSSGHLVIFQHLFGLKEPYLNFDIAVHVGTLVAVLIFFRKDIRSLIGTFMRCLFLLLTNRTGDLPNLANPDVKLMLLIVLGSVPTAVIGLLFHKISDQLFSSVPLVGMMLLITGSLLALTRTIRKKGAGIEGFSFKNAALIGLVQGVAILPGISRSGSTIAAGILLGISRETAARFSFLLSIPAILGATLLMVKDASGGPSFNMGFAVIGALTSCLVGYLSLRFLVYIVNQGRLYYFAPYCWMLGLIAVFT